MIIGLGDKLKALRKKFRFTQKDVANRLNVSASVVAGYEQGNRCPSTEILCRLADIYQCSTDYLLGRDNRKNKLLLDIEGLSETEVEAVTHLIEAMKQSK